MSAARMRGLFPILVTPFDEQDRIDEESLRRLVEYNIEGGVHGFGLAGATEFAKLTEDERAQVTRIVIDQTGKRVPVIATPGAPRRPGPAPTRPGDGADRSGLRSP